ncbi:hypothetical protein Gasu2_38640 [Galdieria sulphuraria]|uniref:Uncharacterized protein n=1 Tax=Galdieria sulphuraria TaxID=130081 RepID=M2W8J0_GALSU|nr:uncharacterized protein Gasu_06090 [Galdieria sulphuraria]EME32196.1 hypothetical protein Gasu_06090 [Galdieria sulphuraria]GJD09620.1 hypothetical protein Gasu2_38640 [Galdieria sulphuraria]|eukprot:XP_005708716.1 hypothetical protein Gasu_06090 [Galdieria sulphuraria]
MRGRGGWQRLVIRNCTSNVSKQENKGQSIASNEKANTRVNTFDAAGLADGQDPLALRKAAWKYGILSLLFGVVAGVIQYKRSAREAKGKENIAENASQTQLSSSRVTEEEQVIPDALVELQLTQIELESQLKCLRANAKTEESLQELERLKERLAQVEKEIEAKANR